jgi:predicted Zn-dependent protease with MMP-like domain
MLKVSEKEFSRIAGRALDRIPEEIMEHVRNVAVVVEDRPDPELLDLMGLPPGEPLLGVYTGTALTEQSLTWPEFYPDTIILFRLPLLEMCRDREELEYEIEITVVHEIAHYFGISEERLIELGYE